jgi:hypothetical protein
MQRRILSVFGLFVAVGMVFAANGCSVICFGLGAAVDAKSPDTTTVSALQIEKVKVGAGLRVILKNGAKVSGKYRGTDRISQEEYAEAYARFREQKQGELFLPPLGGTIAVTLHSGTQEKREFLGFDHQYVTIEPEEETPTSVVTATRLLTILTSADTTSGILAVSDIDQIFDSGGRAVDVKSIERLARANHLPVLAAIAIEDSIGSRLIPIHEVDEIGAPKKKTAKWIGLALGAGIDLIILASILTFDNITIFEDKD